jgi:hypothetical protein
MVVREYLVENYGFDDSQLKTLGMGKQTSASPDKDGGSIQILIFPTGTEMPIDKPAPTSVSATVDVSKPAQITAVATAQK